MARATIFPLIVGRVIRCTTACDEQNLNLVGTLPGIFDRPVPLLSGVELCDEALHIEDLNPGCECCRGQL